MTDNDITELKNALASKDGQISVLQNQIESLQNSITEKDSQITSLTKDLKEFRDKERSGLEELLHSFAPKVDCKDMTNKEISAFIEGAKSVENLKNSTPKRSTSVPVGSSDLQNSTKKDVDSLINF